MTSQNADAVSEKQGRFYVGPGGRPLPNENSWARPRGAQLTAGYTVNTYCIIHSALARLAWRAYARRQKHAGKFSGLAALCRMPKTKSIGRPVAEIWPNLARTDRLIDTSYQPTTNQPTYLPASRFASTQL